MKIIQQNTVQRIKAKTDISIFSVAPIGGSIFVPKHLFTFLWLLGTILLCFSNLLIQVSCNTYTFCDNRPVGTTCPVVTACPVEELLKGEVLGSNNTKSTNNLIMESERTHNGRVGAGVLQGCEPETHWTGSSHGAGYHKHIYIYIIQEEKMVKIPLKTN